MQLSGRKTSLALHALRVTSTVTCSDTGNVTASDQRTQESTARPMLTTATTTTRALLSGTSYFLRSQGACGFSLLTYKSHQAALSNDKSSVVCNWTVVQAHPILNNMSLPADVVELIIEAFTTEHTIETKNPDSDDFVPQFHLTPLLRVCRIWYEVTEKYLYRSIGVGSKLRPPQLSRVVFLSKPGYLTRKAQLDQDSYLKRDGHEFAEGLLATLTSNPRLAALVKALRLCIHLVNYRDLPEWTRTNTRILQLCQNVEHVGIRGFDHSELDAIVSVLKEKSLVSFYISKRYLPSFLPGHGGGTGSFSHILDMMRKWPRLQSLRVEEFLDAERSEDSLSLDTAQSSKCCAELQEITFRGTSLFDFEFKALSAMCSGVTKLSVSLHKWRVGSRADTAIDGLCECLHKWSFTLEYLNLDVSDRRDANQPLTEAISGLRALRKLEVARLKLELVSISHLPKLNRFSCLSLHHWTELEILLSDSTKFPSLAFVALEFYDSGEFEDRIEDMCIRRQITIDEWDHCWSYKFDGPVPNASLLL